MGNKSSKNRKYDNTFTEPRRTLEQIRQPALETIDKCIEASNKYVEIANDIKTLIDTSQLTDEQKERIRIHHTVRQPNNWTVT